jgi:hypothetical protein
MLRLNKSYYCSVLFRTFNLILTAKFFRFHLLRGHIQLNFHLIIAKIEACLNQIDNHQGIFEQYLIRIAFQLELFRIFKKKKITSFANSKWVILVGVHYKYKLPAKLIFQEIESKTWILSLSCWIASLYFRFEYNSFCVIVIIFQYEMKDETEHIRKVRKESEMVTEIFDTVAHYSWIAFFLNYSI